MSVEINWTALTSGSEGAYLAEAVRAFIHDRFQQIQLPRFIRSVNVHSFAFGDAAPEIVVKDVCDPLPDFYQQDEDDEDDEDDEEDEEIEAGHARDDAHDSFDDSQIGRERANTEKQSQVHAQLRSSQSRQVGREAGKLVRPLGSGQSRTITDEARSVHHHHTDTASAAKPGALHRPRPLTTENIRHSFFNTHSQQSAIPGGTSNMTHFHLPYSTPFSGPTTPLAAMAGGHFAAAAWPDLHHSQQHQSSQPPAQAGTRTAHRHSASISSITPPSSADPASRPSSQHQHDSLGEFDSLAGLSFDNPHSPSLEPSKERDPNDIQIVAHVRYSGNMQLNVTAELSLDYPMSSFVGIPLQLAITGFSFDGVAIVAHVNRKVYTCFLSPEDAQTFLGPEEAAKREENEGSTPNAATGALLEEIRVESEIGQKDGGKQVLKNLGKVEKFVLEQVRRIFEDEFVFPSFWTFLL